METYEEYIKRTGGRPPRQTDDYARMATVKEFLEPLEMVSLNKKKGPPGMVLHSDGETGYVQTHTVHTFISGPTGSGKSASVIIPSLTYWASTKCPAVVLDPKGELLDKSGRAFEKNGYEVKVLYFRDPMKGIRYNPLSECCRLLRSKSPVDRRKGEAELRDVLHKVIMRNTKGMNNDALYWVEPAWIFLCGLVKELLRRTDKDVTFSMLKHASNLILQDVSHMRSFTKSLGKNNPNLPDLQALLTLSADITRSCVTTNIHRGLNFVGDPAVADLLSGQDVDIHDMSAGKPIVLFIVCPDSTDIYDTLISIILAQIQHMLYEDADRTYNGSLPKEVLFMLDEFANIPQIPEFEKVITTARSRRIRFALAVQSFAQLRERYGPSADTIVSNCSDWVCTAGDVTFSGLLNNRIGSDASGTNIITVNRLRCLQPGHPLVLSGRGNPFITDLTMVKGAEKESYAPELRKPLKERSVEDLLKLLNMKGAEKNQDEIDFWDIEDFFDCGEDDDDVADEGDNDEKDDDDDEVPLYKRNWRPVETDPLEDLRESAEFACDCYYIKDLIATDILTMSQSIVLIMISEGVYSGQKIGTKALLKVQDMLPEKKTVGELLRTVKKILPKECPPEKARQELRSLGIPEDVPDTELNDLILDFRENLDELKFCDLK